MLGTLVDFYYWHNMLCEVFNSPLIPQLLLHLNCSGEEAVHGLLWLGVLVWEGDTVKHENVNNSPLPLLLHVYKDGNHLLIHVSYVF